jgi:hypothetical protein
MSNALAGVLSVWNNPTEEGLNGVVQTLKGAMGDFTLLSHLSRATHFDHGDGIEIIRCEGHRLPKSPMWKVSQRGFTLNKLGDWEREPIPSERTPLYYQENRYDTYEDAVVALAKEPHA